MFYRLAHGPRTPVLYLHGIPTSSTDFNELLGLTSGIAPDLPGFGRSGKAGHLRYTLDAHAGFIVRLLDRLEIERVKLVAHDWGAGGGLLFAQRAPERIERIVLIDALPLWADFSWPRLVRMMRAPVLGELVMGTVSRRRFERLLLQAAVSTDAFPEPRLAEAWLRFDQGTQRATLRILRDACAAGGARLEQIATGLPRLAKPTLVVWGERDPWWPASTARRYLEALPDAQLRVIEGGGHWPWLANSQLAGELAEFLAA